MNANTENTTNRRQTRRKAPNALPKQNAKQADQRMPPPTVPVKRGPGRPKKAETLAREAAAREAKPTNGHAAAGPRRGYKECNSCHSFSPARSRKCTNCGHGFRARGAARKSVSNPVHNENIIADNAQRVKPMSENSAQTRVTPSATKAGRISAAPGRGLKPCPSCGKYVGVRSFECGNCHYSFYRRTPSKRTTGRPDLAQAVERAVMDETLNLEGFADQNADNKQKARAALKMLGVKNPESVIENVADWSQLDAGLAAVLKQQQEEKQSVNPAVINSVRAEPGPDKDTILLHLTLQVPGQYADRYSLVKRAAT